MSVKEGSRQASPWLLAFGIVLGIIGVVLAIGGIELASLGGS